jgi:hypothetical protein
MSLDVNIETNREYLKVSIRGEQNLENNSCVVSTIVDSCVEKGLKKVLIDITEFKGQPGTFADFEVANLVVTEWQLVLNKAAVVYLPENERFTSFFEITVQNRGFNLRSFLNEREAVGWLIEK